MSSWITTVFPTPAPPKRPTLPPLSTGQMRSMTLMPVSRISTFVACSVNSGAWRWIGRRFFAAGASFPSMDSPRTLKMRPRVPCPTGTEIGPPVSRTDMPREMPSVVSMAIARTVLPPSWYAVSRTSFAPPASSTSSALKTAGTVPSNSMSTTGPMIVFIVPFIVVILVVMVCL